MVVLAIHTGKIYTVVKVSDLYANSKFDGTSDKKEAKFRTFAEYFEKKYAKSFTYSYVIQEYIANKH
jgi:endoribonuclease Dicer